MGHKGATRGNERCFVTKVLPVLLMVLMGLHIIKPLGLPGLKKRGDFWKIAAFAIFAMAMAVGFHFAEN
ncbi:hypothetical protein J3U99_16325 [Brucella pituitosa]|uniref:Uncharacterized protein n=1 Tax=Brucella pituitosa TaxID=571256 RepID=A0A643EXJ4_9HYPH|nr:MULTISPECIES: hypothetical protein [Brucella]KAB0568682.1 hypothetical protein F7Q93_17955 [Brucella pituitosa]MCK4206346.1 hypothetical protein [Brucella pituitosa]PJO46248.1 hypothetical protein CWE02_13820 [Brucella pituitosa]PRA85241.1 hypothetical protein CQ054_13885 [Ochrobactrum sp. MYb29]